MTIGSKNPVFVAQRLTDNVVAAAGAATPATTNIVPTGDGVLKLATVINSLYRVSLYIIYQFTATADARFTFTRPANSTLFWTPGAVAAASTTTSSSITKQSVTQGTNAQVGGTGGAAVATIEGILRTYATAGDFEFLAAQWVGEATDGLILTGSSFTLTKLA